MKLQSIISCRVKLVVVFRGISSHEGNLFKKQNMTVKKNWKGNGECATTKLPNTPNFGHMLTNTHAQNLH